MALNNFTITHNPFTGVALTDSNTIYIDSVIGSDSNAGTRNAPKKTLPSSSSIVNNKFYVLRGYFEQDITMHNITSIYFFGEPNTIINGNINFELGNPFFYCYGLKISAVTTSAADTTSFVHRHFYRNCEFINGITIPGGSQVNMTDVITDLCKCELYNVRATIKQAYIRNFAANQTIRNSIITDVINLGTVSADMPYYTTLNHCIVRKQVQWQWNGATIPMNLTTDAQTGLCNTEDAQAALHAYATNVLTNQTHKDSLNRIADNIFGEGTIIYDDDVSAHAMPHLFNGYGDDGITPTDYTLNPAIGNPAMYASDISGFVGAYKPKINTSFNWTAVDIIDNDGNVTGAGAGELITYNNGIFFDNEIAQNRNRVSTNVITMPPGDSFTLFRSLFFASFSDTFYFGALQTSSTTNSPLDAVLIEPYDTATVPSAFPKFFVAINRDYEIAYHVSDGTPVLFSELATLGIATNKNMNEVGDMAVTNAVNEWEDVIALNSVYSGKVSFRHFKITLIANRTNPI
jgi:hypothetical protein